MWDWWWNINNIISFHFKLPGKNNDKTFQENRKPSIEHSYLLKLVVFVLPNHVIVRIGVSLPTPQKYPPPFLFLPRPSHKPTN